MVIAQESSRTRKHVSGAAVRYILDAMTAVDGSRVSAILDQAGLKHLSAVEANTTPVASEEDLARVYTTAYQVMGETMTRLFLSHYGEAVSQVYLSAPPGQELIRQATAVPQAQRVGVAVKLLAEQRSQSVQRIDFSEDQQACYLDAPHCLVCDGVRHARAPYCANLEALFTKVARAASGQRVSCIEIACRATGAPTCRYRIWKL